MSRLGKAYLTEKSIKAWYQDEADSFDIDFSDDKEVVDKFNADSDDSKLMVWLGALSEREVIDIAMGLTSALPTEKVPNIKIETADSKTSEVVTESVPADKVASFPRSLRNLSVEDAPRQDSAPVRNNESLLDV